jgi:hypothetical protein
MNVQTPIKDLQIGDVVNLGLGEGFESSTVVKVTENYVELVRPYVHTSDFTCLAHLYDEEGEGVIDYIGTERMTLCKRDTRPVTLVYRRRIPLK